MFYCISVEWLISLSVFTSSDHQVIGLFECRKCDLQAFRGSKIQNISRGRALDLGGRAKLTTPPDPHLFSSAASRPRTWLRGYTSRQHGFHGFHGFHFQILFDKKKLARKISRQTKKSVQNLGTVNNLGTVKNLSTGLKFSHRPKIYSFFTDFSTDKVCPTNGLLKNSKI